MHFKPHHNFDNCVRLEQLVTRLNKVGKITGDTYGNFNRYHPAMIHKLRSAKYNLERLTEKLTTANVQDVANSAGDFMFEVNMYIDGFFYNAGSAMDILARVVLTLFGEQLTGDIYFQTAHNRINTSRPGDAILLKLSKPIWHKSFSDYRNTLTHELILASQCQITLDMTSASQPNSIVFPLPDVPRAIPSERTYRRNPDVRKYVSDHFRRVLSLVNQVYGDIADRGTTAGSLPIPI